MCTNRKQTIDVHRGWSNGSWWSCSSRDTRCLGCSKRFPDDRLATHYRQHLSLTPNSSCVVPLANDDGTSSLCGRSAQARRGRVDVVLRRAAVVLCIKVFLGLFECCSSFCRSACVVSKQQSLLVWSDCADDELVIWYLARYQRLHAIASKNSVDLH